jgi:hypothetical protein
MAHNLSGDGSTLEVRRGEWHQALPAPAAKGFGAPAANGLGASFCGIPKRLNPGGGAVSFPSPLSSVSLSNAPLFVNPAVPASPPSDASSAARHGAGAARARRPGPHRDARQRRARAGACDPRKDGLVANADAIDEAIARELVQTAKGCLARSAH